MSDQPDMINHPPHYTSCPSGIECIEIAELLPFCLGNCYKYLHRAGLKGDALPDLEKALWYAKRAMVNGETLTKRAYTRINAVHRLAGKKRPLEVRSAISVFANSFYHDFEAMQFIKHLAIEIHSLKNAKKSE